MSMVCVQYRYKRWPFLNDSDACMAMAMDSPLVAFGQAEKPFEIEIVLNFGKLIAAGKETDLEGDHQIGHVLMNRIARPCKSPPQPLEFPSPLPAIPRGWTEGRGNFLDFLHMSSDRCLLVGDELQTAVHAAG
jgi:hypothetical protein